jgi:hypothetical protein
MTAIALIAKYFENIAAEILQHSETHQRFARFAFGEELTAQRFKMETNHMCMFFAFRRSQLRDSRSDNPIDLVEVQFFLGKKHESGNYNQMLDNQDEAQFTLYRILSRIEKDVINNYVISPDIILHGFDRNNVSYEYVSNLPFANLSGIICSMKIPVYIPTVL